MLIIPAVDIKGGRCVRLLQGREEDETVFSHDPLVMALRWEAEGAEILHVIDLDGAFRKKPRNLEVIQKIVDRVNVPVQVGGGIRDMETIKMYINMGVSRVILGTEALRTPTLIFDASHIFPGQIIVGIDARNGFAAIEGWTETTQVRSIDLARRFEGCSLAAIIFTDIQRDGMQTGPSIKGTERLAEAISIPVIASGGVSSIDDIKRLLYLKSSGVIGVVIGRALYAGAINLKEAINFVKQSRHAAST